MKIRKMADGASKAPSDCYMIFTEREISGQAQVPLLPGQDECLKHKGTEGALHTRYPPRDGKTRKEKQDSPVKWGGHIQRPFQKCGFESVPLSTMGEEVYHRVTVI